MDDQRYASSLAGLRGVANDLWTSTARLSRENARQLEALTRELAKDEGIVLPEGWDQPMVLPENPEKKAFPSFDSVWKTADETVDWTEALAYAKARDGLTQEELWAFYHEMAEKVLNGDVSAYLRVLKEKNPLGDLTAYGRAFCVQAESSEKVTVSFEALPEYQQASEDRLSEYLCGLSLRCARDLFALLPVTKVQVEACVNGKVFLQVPFEREELAKVCFATTDPVQLATLCGAVFQQ